MMSKTIDIYTCRVQDHAKLKAQGINWLDTTVKSGDPVFAPTWDMVLGYKQGTITEEQYTEQYKRLMEISWQLHETRWLEVLDTDRLVLGCYCAPGAFCHRRLLAKMMMLVAYQFTDRHPTVRGELTL